MLDRIRRRLTLGYVGIFALIFVLVGLVAAAGFWQELVGQQDELLTQEARNQAENLRDGENRERSWRRDHRSLPGSRSTSRAASPTRIPSPTL